MGSAYFFEFYSVKSARFKPEGESRHRPTHQKTSEHRENMKKWGYRILLGGAQFAAQLSPIKGGYQKSFVIKIKICTPRIFSQ